MTTPDLALRRVHADLLLDLQRIRQLTERRVAGLLANEGLDVTPAQANVLMVLIRNRAPMTARQLAGALEVSDVTVGRFVRALEQRGWLERRRDPDDSRAILIEPTPRARDALPGFIRVSNTVADEAFGTFDRTTVVEMGRAIRTIHENLSGELTLPDTRPGQPHEP